MTCSEENSASRFVLPDDIGRRWCGQDGVLADDELSNAIGRADLQNGLNSLRGEVSAITADDECRILDIDGVEDSLDEVFRVVLVEVLAVYV